MNKYDWKLFALGFLTNVVKHYILLLPGVVLCLLGAWSKLCLAVGLILILADLGYSFFEQWKRT